MGKFDNGKIVIDKIEEEDKIYLSTVLNEIFEYSIGVVIDNKHLIIHVMLDHEPVSRCPFVVVDMLNGTSSEFFKNVEELGKYLAACLKRNASIRYFLSVPLAMMHINRKCEHLRKKE